MFSVWVFDNFFWKALSIFETCVLVKNKFSVRLVSSLESSTIFNENLKVTWVPSFIPDLNLLTCELDNFTFKVLNWVILYWCYIKAKRNCGRHSKYSHDFLPKIKNGSFCFFNNEKHCCIFVSFSNSISRKINLLYYFLISIKCLVIYLNLLSSFCNVFWNRDNLVENQVRNHVLDLL